MVITATRSGDLHDLLRSLYSIRQQKSDLEKTEKAILVNLKPLVDPEFDNLEKADGKVAVGTGNLLLTRITGTSRTIKSELLLERGVSPEIVNYATKTSIYYQYKVREVRENDDES